MKEVCTLSPRKAEYMKYLYLQGGLVKTTRLATHFGVAPSTITKTLEGIASTGLIVHVPYQGVQLTVQGEECARFLLRRHRILALMLSRFGLAPEEACQQATAFEGHVPRCVIDRICASLGHPIMSICGPIEHDTCCCPPECDVGSPQGHEG